MRIKKIIFAAILFFISSSFALLNAQWAKTYGGKGEDCPFSVQHTSDGGYIVAGYTDFFGVGDHDLWILKLDAKGMVVWQKTYGKEDSDGAHSIQQTSDSGYIVAGWIAWGWIVDMPDDFWILKLNPKGNSQWAVFLGDINPLYHSEESAYSIQQTSDAGYIVAGRKKEHEEEYPWSYDFCILKLDSNGEPEWQHMYGGSNKDDYAYSVQQINDGGYIVAGTTESFGAGNKDFWVLKLDSAGDVEWERAYGGSGEDYAESIQQTHDGGFIVAGTTSSFGVAGFDYWVLKLDSSGEIVWQKTYGGNGGDYAHSVQQTDDGGYVIAGSTGSFGAGKVDFWVLKLGTEGEVKWEKAYGGAEYDSAFSVDQASDGGYIVAGKTKSFGVGDFDFLVLKLTSTGAIDPSCGNFVTVTKAIVLDSPASPNPTSNSGQGGGIGVWEYIEDIISPQITTAAVRLICESRGPYTLKIFSTPGGTTDPPPGIYTYPSGEEIVIKALSHTHYRFTHWSGDFSGSTNPITIVIYTDLSIKANFIRIIYPPLNTAGQKMLNRSLSQAEYINVLTWEANPNNVNIVKYRIYQVVGESQSLLVELNADTFQYWHRKVEKDRQYTYLLVAVNDEGREGNPAYLTVQ